MACQSQDIIRRSATNGLTPAPRTQDFQREVAKLVDVIACIGCRTRRVACSEWNNIRDAVGNNVGAYDNLNDLNAESWTIMCSSEVEQNNRLEWLICKDDCMRCSDPGCLKACLAEGTIIQYVNGVVDFQSEQCIGCGYCIADYSFDIPRLNPEGNRVCKCILCTNRVVVGQEPACVKTCPTGAAHFGTKESMKTLASERAAELKTRGYDNVDPYDPAGVDGTHVVYVLHRVDRPDLYHGLPENPEISETVKPWEGIWKPLAAVGFTATPTASTFHYVGVGPNRADEEENNLHEEKDRERKRNDVAPSYATPRRNVSTTRSSSSAPSWRR